MVNNTRVVVFPMRMPDGTIKNFYLRVANDVPEPIVRDMIDKVVDDFMKGIASWH